MSEQRMRPLPAGVHDVARQVFAIERAQQELRRQVSALLDQGDSAEIEKWAMSLTDTNCSWHYYDLGQEILDVIAINRRRAEQASAATRAPDREG